MKRTKRGERDKQMNKRRKEQGRREGFWKDGQMEEGRDEGRKEGSGESFRFSSQKRGLKEGGKKERGNWGPRSQAER